MIHDWTELPAHLSPAQPGYAIHFRCGDQDESPTYELYSDDGSGNGDYICSSTDLYWIRRIAVGLDMQRAEDFDHTGWERVS